MNVTTDSLRNNFTVHHQISLANVEISLKLSDRLTALVSFPIELYEILNKIMSSLCENIKYRCVRLSFSRPSPLVLKIKKKV